MRKRGIAPIIATLFLVFLSLVAISVVWAVISKYITEQSALIETQNEFFSQDAGFSSVMINPADGLQINTSIETAAGKINVNNTQNVTVAPPIINIIDVSDLSGSMGEGECLNLNATCHNKCGSTLGGVGTDADCYSIPAGNVGLCTQKCGGSLTVKINASQNATQQLINNILPNPTNSNNIGIVAYSTSVLNQYSSNLTGNSGALSTIVNSWQASGNTCICCGLNQAKAQFLASNTPGINAIILMTDGIANINCSQQGTGDPLKDTIQAGCDAYAAIPNLTIYSVGFGSDADNATLNATATKCGKGQYFSATQLNSLIGIYQSLAQQIIQQATFYNKLSYLKIIFYDVNGNTITRNVNAPAPLQTISYSFNLDGTGLVAPIVKMEIYPVISQTNGNEVVGPLFSTWIKQ